MTSSIMKAKTLRERIKQLTHDRGVDVIYDAVGGKNMLNQRSRSMNWNGRYLVVGFAAGEIPKIPLNLTLLKGSSLVGVFWGSFMRKEPAEAVKNHMQLMNWLCDGKLKPLISAVYPLEQASRALTDLMETQSQRQSRAGDRFYLPTGMTNVNLSSYSSFFHPPQSYPTFSSPIVQRSTIDALLKAKWLRRTGHSPLRVND
jgi:hypothetical protein